MRVGERTTEPRVPPVRTPTWQDPVIDGLKALQAQVPETEIDLHRRFTQLADAVDYTAWQPNYPWPEGSHLSVALGVSPGSLWTNWVGALLWLAFRMTPRYSHDYTHLLAGIAEALTRIPVEKWSSEQDARSARAYQQYGRLYLDRPQEAGE